MIVSVDVARKSPGEAFGFAFESELGPLEFAGGEVNLIKPVTVQGQAIADSEGINVNGVLRTAFETQCAKCLKLLVEQLNASFDVRYQKASDDDETYTYEGDTIDITQMILDHVLLTLPIRSVCDSSCKGLCPNCGQNLNEGKCACE